MVGASTSGASRPTEDGSSPRQVLEALADDDCRELLAALSGEPRSATELSEQFEIGRSTTYRKLDRLQSVGLVKKHPRVTQRGPTGNEYTLKETCLQIRCSLAEADGPAFSLEEASGQATND